MMCKQMALEWGEHGIRVNCVSPGMIMTPTTRAIYRNDSLARQREVIVPLRRIGVSDDVARAVSFLIEQNITGENIDGGLTLSVLDRIAGGAHRKTDASRPESAGG
jgi:glucose 1-dehydrogenase